MKMIVKSPFAIITGSHIHNLGGTGIRKLVVDEIIDVEESCGMSCSVWITTKDNIRGKIECGEIKNLINSGRAIPYSC
jgi:hypothetical protein